MKKTLEPLWIAIRCKRFSSSSCQVPSSLGRKHVNKSSFNSVNKAFLIHPNSNNIQSKPIITNDQIVHSFEKLENELKLLSLPPVLVNESSKPEDDSFLQQHQIVYLSESELKIAKEKFEKRKASSRESSLKLLKAREPIMPNLSKDVGLEWLHDSDIIFADCSGHVSNENRYIVTRKVDGTLYHNSHTERDEINNSFFCKDHQIYPPIDIFEDDVLFKNCLSSTETKFETLLEYLTRCYPVDHPRFIMRHTQIMKFLFNNPNKMGDLLTSKYFLPLLARAVHEKAHNEMKKVSNLFIKLKRHRLAIIIEEILILDSELAQKPGQDRVRNTIVLLAGQNSISIRDISKSMKNYKTVAMICGIDIESIQHVSTSPGGDLLAKLESEELAAELHNNGAGRVVLYEDRIFSVFPKLEVH